MVEIELEENQKINIFNITVIPKNLKNEFLNFLNFLNFNKSLSSDEKIIVYYSDEESKIKLINEIKHFFSKYKINYSHGDQLKQFLSNLKTDDINFSIIKDLGLQIKNNFINLSNEILEEYNNFLLWSTENFSQKHMPFENQVKSAFFHLKMKKSCNFSAPGTGKTTVAYLLYSWLKNAKKIIDKVIIIGPIASFLSWKEEYAECFGRQVNCPDLKSNYKKIFLYNHEYDIYFLNYEKIIKFEEELITFFNNNRVLIILDEAHRIKNPKNLCTLALNRILKNPKNLDQFQIILTGTPIPNGYQNLFSYFDIINRDKKILHHKYDELSKINNENNIEMIREIRNATLPFYVSVRKKDMPNYKEPIEVIIQCKMVGFQNEIFNAINHKLINKWKNKIDQKIQISFYKTKIIRLMQIQTDVRMLTKKIKEVYDFELTELQRNFEIDDKNSVNFLNSESLIKDLKELGINKPFSQIKKEIELYYSDNKFPEKYIQLLKQVKALILKNEKVVIWSNWVYTIKQINIFLQENGIHSEILYGGIDYNNRETIIQKFKQNDNELMILVANPAAIGESISLHKVCQNAIYFDINYLVTNHFQSKDRIHRYGMPSGKEQVTYFYLISENSIENKIKEIIFSKERKMNNFLDNNEFVEEPDDAEAIFMSENDIRDTLDDN